MAIGKFASAIVRGTVEGDDKLKGRFDFYETNSPFQAKEELDDVLDQVRLITVLKNSVKIPECFIYEPALSSIERNVFSDLGFTSKKTF